MNNERLMVVLAMLVASGFAMTMDSARGQAPASHCDISGRWTCSYNPCGNNNPGAAVIKRLSATTYSFENDLQEPGTGGVDPVTPNTYWAWWKPHEKLSVVVDEACHELIFSNGTHWTRY
ncbi:hypothetical protein AWB67_05628 [Caballeronia terrestris]|uniref:Lipoprotein n=1 Tax=Caballeronia terrestris TaxID=1226301 RepID=A0A158KH45_9BURK|nr:hypothetical protein [Caballeronia terrestris]SAL80462.1 hypothetical protein AWB67_05628 [Caballeronia terrestris]